MCARPQFDQETFRKTLGHYPTGVAVITGVAANGAPAGMVVGSFTSVSMNPPIVAFLPRIDSATFVELRSSGTFCVNVLASDQEALCRTFAVSGGDKFAGVSWTAGPGGAPILDGAVCWIECDWADVLPAGDHYVVMGNVIDMGVQRASLPLLFFQSGYGRFSLPSLTAADPQLLEAAMLAERIRDDVERCGTELGVECAVLAKIGDEIVTILSAGGPSLGAQLSVGHRVPHIAPLGSVFLRDSDENETDRWMKHLVGSPEDTVAHVRANLGRVRARGYSLTLSSDLGETLRTLTAEYSSGNATPAHARSLREVIAESVARYEPEIEPDRLYDLESIAVLLDVPPGEPLLAVRIHDLPPRADSATIDGWIKLLSETGVAASQRLYRA